MSNMYSSSFHASLRLFAATLVIGAAHGQAVSGSIAVKAIAEVELHTVRDGREMSKLVPADRLVSGDWVIYTLEVRNTASGTVHAPTVTYPVPEHVSYVAESAVGPATEVARMCVPSGNQATGCALNPCGNTKGFVSPFSTWRR